MNHRLVIQWESQRSSNDVMQPDPEFDDALLMALRTAVEDLVDLDAQKLTVTVEA